MNSIKKRINNLVIIGRSLFTYDSPSRKAAITQLLMVLILLMVAVILMGRVRVTKL